MNRKMLTATACLVLFVGFLFGSLPAVAADSKIEKVVQKSQTWFAKGEYQKALPGFQKAVAAEPENASFHRQLGMTYDALAKFDEAIGAYKTALKFAKAELSLIYNDLGVSYGKSRKVDEAIAAFRESLRHDPKYVGALFNLGMAYHAKGDRRGALSQFNKLKVLDIDVAQHLMEKISAGVAAKEKN